MTLPRPSDRLAGCCWLPRFAAKVRLARTGQLPVTYRLALASSLGIDGYFLRHFGLTPQDFFKAVVRAADDTALAEWFRAQSSVTDDSIERWNHVARHLGAPGHPGRLTLHLVKWVLYPKAILHPVGSLFEAIEQDEQS
ncbi:MAG: DUF5069 domain-containing protein [Nitrospira sp.]